MRTTYYLSGLVMVGLLSSGCSGDSGEASDNALSGAAKDAAGPVRTDSHATPATAPVGAVAAGETVTGAGKGSSDISEGDSPALAEPGTAPLPGPGAEIPASAVSPTPVTATPAGVSPGASPATPVAPPAGAAADDAVAPAPPSDPAPTATTPTVTPEPQSGLLTAGTWDDNRNFDRFTSFKKGFVDQQMPGLLDFAQKDYQAANTLFKDLGDAKQTLDVALLIDTTGSMGDEIGYLQTEIDSIASRIEKSYPDAKQRWALVVYRDVGDEYVSQSYDFDSDLETFRAVLDGQEASGGGDFPESPDVGLAAMNHLDWRTSDSTARLAFWVADAPYHNEKADDMSDAVRGAQDKGVHVYPVASSGIDDFTELAMRSTAQLTGGRYLFLTNDSGVGGDHKEPSIPCYFVTRLDGAILRMIDIEMTAEYREPDADAIIRTGGDPKDGACKLESGEAVFVF